MPLPKCKSLKVIIISVDKSIMFDNLLNFLVKHSASKCVGYCTEEWWITSNVFHNLGTILDVGS